MVKWRMPRVKPSPGLTALLRNLGFEHADLLLRKWLGLTEEPPKVILTRSIWVTLGRNVVHIIPIALLVALIWLNYTRIFIGPTFSENGDRDEYLQAVIQVGAKLIELLCVSSLTCIVLHALRHELLETSDGLPVGLLGSGLWFNTPSSFWSPDFLGSFTWKKAWPTWSRLRFVFILLVCGLLAVTIGPASALLMTPKLQLYPAGGASIYMPGTPDDFYPGYLTASTEPAVCRFPNATEYAVCPSGGFKSLYSTFALGPIDNFCPTIGVEYSPHCQARGAEGNREWDNFVIEHPRNLMPSLLNSFRKWGSATVTQTHAATATVMQQVVAIWITVAQQSNSYLNAQYKWTYEVEALGLASNPTVRVQCPAIQNLSELADTANFPSLTTASDNTSQWGDMKPWNISSLNRSATAYLRAQWIQLPIDSYGDAEWGMTTTGLLVELPWVGNSRTVIGCAIASSWHEVNIQSIRSQAYGAWRVALSGLDFGNTIDSPNARAYQRPITLDPTWLALLTAPSSADYSLAHVPNTLESLLEGTGMVQRQDEFRTRSHTLYQNGTCIPGVMYDASLTNTEIWLDTACGNANWKFAMENSIAMLVADGILRFGSHNAFNMAPYLSDWTTKQLQTFNTSKILTGPLVNYAQPATTLANQWVAISIQGYAWNPSANGEYMALSCICIYLITAFSFLNYTIFWKAVPTSDSWKSVTELLVLCQNSPPPDENNHKLQNASAGIQSLKTYRAKVRIRAVSSEDGTDKPRVCLVVDGAEDTSSSTISTRHEVTPTGRKDGRADVEVIELISSSGSSSSQPIPSGNRKQLERIVVDEEYV